MMNSAQDRPRPRPGFSILELLVAMAILAILVAVVLTMTTTVGRVWRQSRDSMESFRSAREAFETMTDKLSQATLGTYWDYDPPQTGTKPAQPTRYVRKSDLHFVSGKALPSGITSNPALAHYVMFQAPLGRAGTNYSGLNSLLDSVGYYVTFDGGTNNRPSFAAADPPRYRFRLMEYGGLSESLPVYARTNAVPQWLGAAADATASSHVLAENVVAMAIVPRRSSQDVTVQSVLGTDFEYNSRANARADPQPAEAHQLPPIVEVILVVIDEDSAARLQDRHGADAFNHLGFRHADVFQDPARIDDDLAAIETALQAQNIRHRVFRMNVLLRNSKWSGE